MCANPSRWYGEGNLLHHRFAVSVGSLCIIACRKCLHRCDYHDKVCRTSFRRGVWTLVICQTLSLLVSIMSRPLFIAVLTLSWLQTILASSSQNAESTTWNTPSYYPGGPWVLPGPQTRPNVCRVKAPADGSDSAPAIVDAFKRCGHNGKVVFENTTYHVGSVMNTTGLYNVEVDIRGTLLWSTDVGYWLEHSLPVGYQNQSSAWFFGGHNIHLHGNGAGTFNGNGQTWYDYVGAYSNFPRRPHAITFSKMTDSVVEGMRFLQSQMWTMTLIHSNNVLLQDIYVNSTNLKGGPDQNTDGADTIYSNNITFVRWQIKNGDDSLSCKANSTNILMEDCHFTDGDGLAMGSIGQFPGQYEIIENVTARNIYMNGSYQGGYAKTWTGVQQGFPPNGGGGGTGYMKNITFTNLTLENVHMAFDITQCNSYIGAVGECDTSTFQISDLHWTDVRGTQQSKDVVSFQCSGAVPCTGVDVSNIHMTINDTGVPATGYLCSNVSHPIGFKCNGLTSQT